MWFNLILEETCGGVILTTNRSPGYVDIQTPSSYSNANNSGMICAWKIQVN